MLSIWLFIITLIGDSYVLLQAIRLRILWTRFDSADSHNSLSVPYSTVQVLLDCNYSSTQVFFLQRIIIIFTSQPSGGQKIFNLNTLLRVAPYSFLMCTINMLTSYCVTVMPLAAFMAFKKFVVFFVLVVGICMSIPDNFNRVHHCCIFAIVIGGLMIGEKDIFKGEFLGYLSSLVYTFLEALTLQMSTLLYQRHGISPRGKVVPNQE